MVVIDTPPQLENAGTVYSALRVADIAVVPCAPTSHETDALTDVWAAIEEVPLLRNVPTAAAALFTRSIANASSTGNYRQAIEDGGHRVLTTTIPRREAYAQALDAPIRDRTEHFTEALNHTDQLVIPVAAGRDSAAVAQKMMHSLVATGRPDLVRGAVVLLHDLEPADPGSLHVAQDIAAELEPQVAAVVAAPIDPALKERARIEAPALTEATRTAYRQAAAAVAHTLKEATDRSASRHSCPL